MKKISTLILLVTLGFLFTPMAQADDAANDNASLKAEVEALKARLTQLETKLAAQPAAVSTAPAEGIPSLAIPSMVKGIGLSGYVDSIYSYNFNAPDSRANDTARVFDRHPNSYNINAVELVFQKPVSADSRAGFRTDLFMGNDAEVITSTGLGGTAPTSNQFDLQQAYAEVLIPTSNAIKGLNDIDLKVGKFVTMNGAEVIESKDNWNTSRSLLFGFAIPFTHTGMRGTYTFNNGWDIAVGAVNGWDVTDDNNNGKTIETHVGFNNIALPGDSSLTVALQGYFGPEQGPPQSNALNTPPASDSNYRNLFDTVIIYKTPWKPLTLMYNYDYAGEENVITDPNSTKATLVDSVHWQGHAAYGRIDINDQWSVSGRYEYFMDHNHVRIAPATGTIPADNYWEVTGTLEYRPWKNIVTRLEYRHDDADQPSFSHAGGLAPGTRAFSDTQDTISGEVMFIF